MQIDSQSHRYKGEEYSVRRWGDGWAVEAGWWFFTRGGEKDYRTEILQTYASKAEAEAAAARCRDSTP